MQQLKFQPGDRIRLHNLGMNGVVVALNGVTPKDAERAIAAAGSIQAASLGARYSSLISIDSFYPADRYPYIVEREDGRTFPYGEHDLAPLEESA